MKKKQDLQSQKNREQEVILHLKSKKRSLELELEAVVRHLTNVAERSRL